MKCFSFFIVCILGAVQAQIAYADRFAEFANIAPKVSESLAETGLSDQYIMRQAMMMTSRILRLNGGLLKNLESKPEHSELTAEGVPSVLKTMEDMGVKEQVANNELFMQPLMSQGAELLERKVVDGVLTWTFLMSADVRFKELIKQASPIENKAYSFLVDVVRTNDQKYHQRIVVNRIELKQ